MGPCSSHINKAKKRRPSDDGYIDEQSQSQDPAEDSQEEHNEEAMSDMKASNQVSESVSKSLAVPTPVFLVDTPAFGETKAGTLLDVLLNKSKLKEIRLKSTLTDFLLHYNITTYPETLREIIERFIQEVVLHLCLPLSSYSLPLIIILGQKKV
jgi:hypothetical protein